MVTTALSSGGAVCHHACQAKSQSRVLCSTSKKNLYFFLLVSIERRAKRRRSYITITGLRTKEATVLRCGSKAGGELGKFFWHAH